MKNIIRRIGIMMSILVGFLAEAMVYFVFGINPVYVPFSAMAGLWAANSLIAACVADEVMKRKYHIRIYRRRASGRQ